MKAEFISRVMQIMNELGWNDTESGAFIGSDTTKVKGHIENVFTDAWRKAVTLLPRNYFTIADFSDNKLIPDIAHGTGYVELPEDFYLLVLFKMKGWQKPVETLVESTDQITSIQANVYTRGNIVRPVCVKNQKRYNKREGNTTTFDIKTVLEYYSLPSGMSHEIDTALYIPLIGQLSETTILGEKLFTPLAYICAGMVYEIFEKPEIAKTLEAKAIEISI